MVKASGGNARWSWSKRPSITHGRQTGTGVTLPVHVITVTNTVLATEHVVQANLPEGGDACVRGDMAAEALMPVRARDHHRSTECRGCAPPSRGHRDRPAHPGHDGVEVRRLGQVTYVHASLRAAVTVASRTSCARSAPLRSLTARMDSVHSTISSGCRWSRCCLWWPSMAFRRSGWGRPGSGSGAGTGAASAGPRQVRLRCRRRLPQPRTGRRFRPRQDHPRHP